ncbi:tetratricopeptide repeat protein [Novosphingobium sp.]|uniref:tetratricopeptide repeat protein n=1 Tax=Novosphingobium sp. TaxID=1874826 RepID=UPI00286A6576|nr:tetratricopeptide repeat protein [Novosphingobium sp.]
MKNTITIPVAAMLLALAACADSPAESFAKAQKEYAANNYAAARIHLANALNEEPGNRAMLLLKAQTLIALGDGEGAAAALQQLVGTAKPTDQLAELSAEAALLRGASDVSTAFLTGIETAEADRLRAMAAIQKGDLPLAAQHFEKGLARGGNARLYADYARFRLMAGDLPGATDMAAKAARLAPGGIDTLLVSGEIAVRRGDLNSALGFYDQAQRLYPASIAALVGKAAVLGDLGRTDEMKPLVAKAAQAAPKDLGVIFLQVKLAASAKDWTRVRDLVQPLETTLAPISPVRLMYGEALLRLNLAEQAIAQLRPLAQALPANREVALVLAEALLVSGDPQAAMALLKPFADSPLARRAELVLMARIAKAAGSPAAAGYQARANAPQPQSLTRDMADADAAMRAGNWAGAVAAYDRVLAVTDGRNVMVLNNVAYAQLILGNTAKALEFADRALKLAPANPSVLDTAGWAQFKSGSNPERARQLLRKAAQLAPKNMTIRAHLAEAERTPD